jgi:signal transduction histidine kinase/ligand-binding sensor domain-containing protein
MLAIAAIAAGPAAAVAPRLLLTQYTHRVWTVGFNGLNTAPMAITQAPDGYLLFGAQDGIYRFNGERFQTWQPWGNTTRKPSYIEHLVFARDGSLYIAGFDNLARYKDGRIFFFKERLREPLPFEDGSGRVWVGQLGRDKDPNLFCRIDGNRIVCQDSAAGGFCSFGLGGAPGLHGGVLWFSRDGACGLSKAGRESHYDYPGGKSMGYARGVPDRAGHLDVMLRSATRELYVETDGSRWKSIPGADKIHDGHVLFRDREGALWIGTWRSGLWRVFNGRAEHYTHADGLSGDSVWSIFEDREGSVWVATERGVDQFRAPAIVRYAGQEGLSGDRPANLFVTQSGELWVPNVDGIDAFREGRLVLPSPHVSPRKDVYTVVQDSNGRIWSLIGFRGVFYENEQKPVHNDLDVSLRDPQDLVATADGSVWTGGVTRDRSAPLGMLVQMRAGRVVAAFPTPGSVDRGAIYKLANDGKDGIWVALANHGALLFRNGRFSDLPVPASIKVDAIAPIEPGSAWMATLDGLYHVVANGAARRLGTADGLPCESFSAVVTDSRGDLWLKSDCGLLRIARHELDSFLTSEGSKLHADRIDAADGAPIGLEDMHAVRTPDDRIWFSNLSGLFMVDTKARVQARQPIPAIIEDIIADGKSFLSVEGRRSPTLPRRIEISFSGIDFQRPDRLSFRYVLSRGRQEWRGETAERSVSFTDLGPGAYHFTIVACENGTLCSRKPATLAFEIPPTFTQTWLFKVALAFLGAFVAWIGYRVWHRQVTLDIQRRTEARLGERERIARDLHDTLLQGFQGLLLRLQGVANSLSREDPVRNGLENALDRGEQIIVEGRDRVRDLRADENGLPEVLQKFIDDASLDCDVDIDLEIQGFRRDLRRGIATEVGQIAREALSNACRHADASRITITAEFGHRQLRVRIADDGKGLSARPSETDGTPHFGLSGMRERAERMKGSLTIDSAAGKGTEISLSLASNVAYVPKSSHVADLPGRIRDWFDRASGRFPGRSSGTGSST